MAIAILLPKIGSTPANLTDSLNAVGDADKATCIRVQDDGKYLEGLNIDGGGDARDEGFTFNDDGTIPVAAPINSVTFVVRHRCIQSLINTYVLPRALYTNPFSQFLTFIAEPPPDDNGHLTESPFYTEWATDPMLTKPGGGAWTRADLFSTGAGGTSGRWSIGAGSEGLLGQNLTYRVDIVYLRVDYVGASDVEASGGSSPDFSYNITGGMLVGGGVDGTSALVMITDGSGLYTLTPGKTNDTLYARNNSRLTVDVKIPDPFAKLAYFGD